MNLTQLNTAIQSASAIRCRARLQPAGGDGSKVFPPTYADGPYATEERVMQITEDGVAKIVRVPTVLLDSVQSQANRMELALLQGLREKKLSFPLIEVDFSGCTDNDPVKNLTDLVEINSLTAPHRVADAILRDSLLNNTKFRDSDIGKSFVNASSRNATALYNICPTALLFGVWDSTGPKGGLGAKFARAIVSEIVGFDVESGKKPSSRLDPLAIEKSAGPVYKTTDGGWTLDATASNVVKEKGKAVEEDPSAINHGNIPPTLKKKNSSEYSTGGFTIGYALETCVLSLPALRRLCFPVSNPAPDQASANLAGRTVLAALGLCAMTWKQRAGYDLRSGCLLVPESEPVLEILSAGKSDSYTLTAESAAELLKSAVDEATKSGLTWQTAPLQLIPSPNLQELIRRSRAKVATAPVAE